VKNKNSTPRSRVIKNEIFMKRGTARNLFGEKVFSANKKAQKLKKGEL
jgi:hypothetical protein